MYQTDFSSDEFVARCARVYEAVGKEAVALIQGGPKEESHDLFRQTNDFYYLCGVEVPHAYLLIDGRANTSHLFLPHQSQERREKEGEELSPENADVACQLTGVNSVHGIEGLGRFLERTKVIYTPFRNAEGAAMSWDTLQRAHQDAVADPWEGQKDRMRSFVALLKDRVPGADIQDLVPALDGLRLVKSEREIAFMRKAGTLTGMAVAEAMRSTRPGVMEYQLDAILGA